MLLRSRRNKFSNVPDTINNSPNFPQFNNVPNVSNAQNNAITAANSAIVNNNPISSNVSIRTQLEEIAAIEQQLPWLTVVGTGISTLSHEDTKAMSILQIRKGVNKESLINSPLLGPISTNVQCSTCGKVDCPGHYSYIDFKITINQEDVQLYFINPILSKILVRILNCVCSSCSKLIITEEYMKEKGIFNIAPSIKRLKLLSIKCLEVKECMADKSDRDVIPSNVIMSCSPIRTYSRGNFKTDGTLAYQYPKDKSAAKITAAEIFSILDNVSRKDATLLGFNQRSHPRDLILRSLLVIPPVARPAEFYNSQLNQHHLTNTYNQIMSKLNNIHTLNDTAYNNIFQEICKLFVKKSDTKANGFMNSVSIVKLLQGKNALIRKEVIAKRINQCARTVITGDTDIPCWYITAPAMWQQKLARQEKVTFFNKKILTEFLKEGKIYYVIDGKTRERKYRAPYIKIGDTVEVRLESDAFITFGRQPTLGPESFMAARVLFKADQLTIGLHLSYSTPLNADFDGDENHLEVPQGVKAEVEMRELMMTTRNLMKTGSPAPVMGLVMNAIIASYLLSNPTYQIPLYLYSILAQNVKSNSSPEQQMSFLQRCYDLGLSPFSGNALYSQTFPPDFSYQKDDVLVVLGLLTQGRLTKSHLGTSTRSIVHDLIKYYEQDRAAIFITEAVRLCNNWLIETGFTVGERDLSTYAIDESGAKVEVNQYIIKQKLAEFYLKVEALYQQEIDKNNKVELEYQENLVLDAINELNENAQLLVRDGALRADNAIVEMSDQRSGMKADLTNIAKITTIAGQMYYESGRIAPDPHTHRTLPSFDVNSSDPAAYGFIESGFSKGSTPSNFFFSQLSARLNVSDSASRTPLTGALERNLIKIGENMVIGENGCIINNSNYLISTTFNHGIAVNQSMGNNSAIDLTSIVRKHNAKYGWIPKETKIDVNIRTKYKDYFTRNNITSISDYSPTKITKSVSERMHTNFKPAPAAHYKLSKYEVAAVIGERARMLEEGAIPLVPVNTSDRKYESRSAVNIAYREYEKKLYKSIGLHIIRRFPDNGIELIELNDDRLTPASNHLEMY